MSDITGSFTATFVFSPEFTGFATKTSSFTAEFEFSSRFEGHTNSLTLGVNTPGSLVQTGAAYMKADATDDFAYVEKNLGADYSEVWVTYQIRFDEDTLAIWSGDSFSEDLDEMWDPGHINPIDGTSIINFSGLAWATYFDNGGSPEAGTHTVEHHLITGPSSAFSDLYIDGDLVASDDPPAMDDVRYIRLGLAEASPGNPLGGIAYFDDVKVGTTREGDDIFSDDFSSGNLSSWTTTFGDVSAVVVAGGLTPGIVGTLTLA